MGLAWHNLDLAVREDPDFFMAYFWMYFMSSKNSKKVAEKALQSNAALNEGEQLIKTAFKELSKYSHFIPNAKHIEIKKDAILIYKQAIMIVLCISFYLQLNNIN